MPGTDFDHDCAGFQCIHELPIEHIEAYVEMWSSSPLKGRL